MPRATEKARAKDRRHAKAVEADIADSREKAFKKETIALLQGAWNLDPAVIGDRMSTEPGRLACTLTFLLTLTREVIRNERPPFLAEDHPRLRLAHEAYRLLQDVVHDNRTSLDTFFSGAKKLGRPSYSIDNHINAILAACIDRLETINPGRDVTRVDIIGWMRGNEVLSERMTGDDAQVNTMYHAQLAKKSDQFQYYQRLFKADNYDDTVLVIERAAYCVGLRSDPLDMGWAVRQALHGVAIRDENGNTTLIPPEVRHGRAPLQALPNSTPLLKKEG
ncbi:hypothetical protein ACQKQD_18335 [Methylobacterium sp. NPDC080182]|uniref:hypothetical protein n=1 Tax=Methylobacterium sp. NPDC080182 TaxID=3390590 RepID=UPI003D007F01